MFHVLYRNPDVFTYVTPCVLLNICFYAQNINGKKNRFSNFGFGRICICLSKFECYEAFVYMPPPTTNNECTLEFEEREHESKS